MTYHPYEEQWTFSGWLVSAKHPVSNRFNVKAATTLKEVERFKANYEKALFTNISVQLLARMEI
jgi:hypothetical protein